MLSTLLETLFPAAHAEEAKEDESKPEEASADQAESGDGDDAAEEATEAAEEEDEEEPEDQAPAIQEKCAEKDCKAALHHFEECQTRVTEGKPKYGEHEDCVEEFFHLRHCVDNCSAKKVFAVLK